MAAKVNPKKCTACETCLDVCPAGAIHMENWIAIVSPELCVDCGACIDVCPSKAIELDMEDGFGHSSCIVEEDENTVDCEGELKKQKKTKKKKAAKKKVTKEKREKE